MVVAFGTMFNDIKMYRYTKDGQTEIERITVPLSYVNKEKFYARITQNPNLNKETQVELPRMSFEMTAINYDPLRKISTFNNQFATGTNGNSIRSYKSSPYNFSFELNIYVRNVEDGTQIVEQILPFFAPDHTLSVNVTGLSGDKIDLPIILETITYDQNAIGEEDTFRTLVWTLTFTVQGWMYGYINDAAKIIRKSTANTYDSTYSLNNQKIITLSSGTGNYRVGELVFEGRTLGSANASAFVEGWDNVSKKIVVSDVNGVLEVNRRLFGAVSNTAYTISSFDQFPEQFTMLSVHPNPLSANSNSDFGFTEVYQEYPYVGNFEVTDSTLITADNNNLSVDDNDG